MRIIVSASFCCVMLSAVLAAAEEKSGAGAEAKTEKPIIEVIEKAVELTNAIKAANARLVLVNGWGSTCGPCLEEMPMLANLVLKDLKDPKDIAVLGLSLDGSLFDRADAIAKSAEVVKEKGLPYKNYVWVGELDPLVETFKIASTPYNAIFKGDGTLLEVLKLPHEPEKARKVLKEKLKEALKKLDAEPAAKTTEADAGRNEERK